MIEVGDVWRKAGPIGWWRVVGVQMPGRAGYDGGLPGVSVRISDAVWGKLSSGKEGWKPSWPHLVWFVPAGNTQAFARAARAGHRRLVPRMLRRDARKRNTEYRSIENAR